MKIALLGFCVYHFETSKTFSQREKIEREHDYNLF